MKPVVLRSLSCLFLAPALVACLPSDSRSPPATVVLSVESDEAIRSGIPAEATADGWSIRYERFLVVFGEGELGGDDCDDYVERGYARIFDLTRQGPQRVNVLFGLGRCDPRFSITTPEWDTLRGEGVSEDDELAMRIPGQDSVSDGLGVSVWVEGHAARGDESKLFSWRFRRVIDYEHCEVRTADGVQGELSLAGHEDVEVGVLMRGAPLFTDGVDENAAVRFEPFREADDAYGDANGVVTLEELEATPLVGRTAATLGEQLYLELLPEIVRYRGAGRCDYEATSEPDDFDGP